MQKQSFLRGTFILTAAALITRMLGFVNGVLQARLMGAEGVGLMNLVFPMLPLIVTLTEMGLPIAISKVVAEAEAKGEHWKIRRILQISLVFSCSSSILLILLVYACSHTIASWFLADQRAYLAMLAVVPIAPIVAISAVFKGYYRGKQNMEPIATSDILENVTEILAIVVLLHWLLPLGLRYAAAGGVISVVVGEAVSLIYLISVMKLDSHRQGEAEHYAAGAATPLDALSRGPGFWRATREIALDLLRIGLPTTGNGFIFSIYRAFQPMLVIKSLALAGIGTALATKEYGMMTGYAFPLLFLPGFITQSLSTALIPAISEAWANRNGVLIHRRLGQAVRLGLIVGVPSSLILYLWAVPLTTAVYHMPSAGFILRVMAPIFLLHFFEAPLSSVLLGLGRAQAVMWNYIAATSLKAGAIVLFGSHYGILGVALAINVGMCFEMLLNFFSVTSIIGFYMELRDYWKVGICGAVMAISGQALFRALNHEGWPLIWSLACSLGGALLLYGAGLWITKAVTRRDARRIPALRKFVAP